MSNLLSKLVRLAHAQPALRKDLLPLIKSASALAVGQTVENSALRIHRYNSSIRVWDLTNAGKRGKTVDGFALYDLDYVSGTPEGEAEIKKLTALLPRLTFYAKAVKAAQEMLERANGARGIGLVKMEFSKSRGVDIDPLMTEKVIVKGPHMSVGITANDFVIRDLTDMHNEPVMIPGRRRATSTKLLYSWALANRSNIPSMTYPQLRKVMEGLGVVYHEFMAVD